LRHFAKKDKSEPQGGTRGVVINDNGFKSTWQFLSYIITGKKAAAM